MHQKRRIIELLAVALALTASSRTETVLLRYPAPAISSVRSYAGTVQVTSTPVLPSGNVVFLLLPDQSSPEVLERFSAGISALWPAIIGGHSVRIARLSGASLDLSGPFSTRTKFRSALAEMTSTTPRPAEAATDLYNHILSNVGQLGQDWSILVLVGDLPLEEHVARYASARCARAFSEQRIRVKTFGWNPSTRNTLSATLAVTGGSIVDDLSVLFGVAEGESQSFVEITWPRPAIASGFHLHTVELLNSAEAAYLQASSVSSTSGLSLPSSVRFAELDTALDRAIAILNRPA